MNFRTCVIVAVMFVVTALRGSVAFVPHWRALSEEDQLQILSDMRDKYEAEDYNDWVTVTGMCVLA